MAYICTTAASDNPQLWHFLHYPERQKLPLKPSWLLKSTPKSRVFGGGHPTLWYSLAVQHMLVSNSWKWPRTRTIFYPQRLQAMQPKRPLRHKYYYTCPRLVGPLQIDFMPLQIVYTPL